MARETKTRPAGERHEAPPLSGVADFQRAGLGALAWMGTWWMEQIEDMGAEWLSFVAHRVGEDVRTQHRILRCTTPDEIQQVQAEFLLKAFEDYAAENGKLLEMGSAMQARLQAAASGNPARGEDPERHSTPV